MRSNKQIFLLYTNFEIFPKSIGISVFIYEFLFYHIFISISIVLSRGSESIIGGQERITFDESDGIMYCRKANGASFVGRTRRLIQNNKICVRFELDHAIIIRLVDREGVETVFIQKSKLDRNVVQDLY